MPSSLNYVRPQRLPKSTYPPPANAERALAAIAKLRESWHRLHDLDRAVAVRDIVNLGVSRRGLARELGFSEGLMRHLLKSLDAPTADQELARRNAISTNEMVRRALGRGKTSTTEPPVAAETLPTKCSPPRRPAALGIPLLPLLKRAPEPMNRVDAKLAKARIREQLRYRWGY